MLETPPQPKKAVKAKQAKKAAKEKEADRPVGRFILEKMMADGEDRELSAVLQEMGDLLAQAQAKDRAILYILMEVVRELARMTTRPREISRQHV